MFDDADLDDATKGFPPHRQALSSQIGARGWNLLRGDIPLPAAVIRLSALERNAHWMQRFVEKAGALLAPHVKTTMCPPIIRRQLDAGAWGLTVATVQQMRICRRLGAQRIILANQPVGPAELACIAEELRRDPAFDFYCLADSADGVALLAEASARGRIGRPIQVLVELGFEGGRTGARSIERALAVARAVKSAEPVLALAGIEGFEGMLPVDAPAGMPTVDLFLSDMAALYRRCRDEALFGMARPILTAGGSIHYDRVLRAFSGIGVSVVTRSGCYVTQDSGIYEAAHRALNAGRTLEGGLERALEIWTYVQSRPEPGLALLTAGRRDFGTDAGLPVPLLLSRGGSPPSPLTEQGWEIFGANDQHAYLRVPAEADIRIGDRVGLGISHPCTTLDKWRVLLAVDDDYTVIDAYRTYF